MEFNYKGIRVIYNENFDNEETISDFLDELFEFYYEDLKNVKVIDFSNDNSDYFLIDGEPYQYSGGRLYLFDVENDEISESFKGQEYFEYRDLCKELGLETYDKIIEFAKEHKCKNDQELLNALRDVVKSKNECVDDVRFIENVNEDLQYEKYTFNNFVLYKKDGSEETAKIEVEHCIKNDDDYDVSNDYTVYLDGSYIYNSPYWPDWEDVTTELIAHDPDLVGIGYVPPRGKWERTIIDSNLEAEEENINEDLFNPEEATEDKPVEDTKDEKAEEEPQTFEEKMDFLAADEQEAIDGYEKIIATIDDEHVKEQLNKIMIEEKAHKEYLEKVKEDQTIEYTEPLEDEEESEDEKEEIDEDLKLREGREVNDLSWTEICGKMQDEPLIALNGGNKYQYVDKVKDLDGNEKPAVIGYFTSLKDLYNDYPKAKKLKVYIPVKA